MNLIASILFTTLSLASSSSDAHNTKIVGPSEIECRAIATEHESWEDACERVYNVDPAEWDLKTGKHTKHVSTAKTATPEVAKATMGVTSAKVSLANARKALKTAKAKASAERKAKRAAMSAARKAAREAASQAKADAVETDPADY